MSVKQKSSFLEAAWFVSLVALSGCKAETSSAGRDMPSGNHPGVPTSVPSAAATKALDGLELVTAPEILDRIRKGSARGTLVNVWASWCGSCKQEFPMLTGLARDLKAEGINVFFVSVDEEHEQAKALAFLKEQGAPLPGMIAAGDLGPFKQTLNPRWKGMIPASFLFDETAKLRYYWGGPVFAEDVLPILQGFLAGEQIDGEANFGLAPGRIDR